MNTKLLYQNILLLNIIIFINIGFGLCFYGIIFGKQKQFLSKWVFEIIEKNRVGTHISTFSLSFSS